MKKIKLLHIGFSYKVGGIEVFATNILKNIDKEKFDIYFINVFQAAKSESFYSEMSNIGKVFDLPDYRKHPFKFFREFKKLNKIHNFDILHYNMASSVFLLPLITAKICGIKNIISHAHNNASDKGIFKSFIHFINKRFIPLFANHYFACSESAAKWFYGKNILKNNKYNVVKNSIDVNKFIFNTHIRTELRKELGIPNDAVVYGHVGSFKSIKNHEFLIEIFHEIYKKENNSYLVLVGRGPLLDTIKNKVNFLGLNDKVIFCGQKENVSDYLNVMDSFILPSFNEGLGIVLIEAQANGLPCFVSDSIPLEAEVNKNFFRLSLIDSASVWADFIINCAKERAFSDKILNYDITSNVKFLSDLYDEMCKIKICHFVYGIKNGGVEKVLTSYFSNINLDDYELHLVYQGDPDLVNLKEFENLSFITHCVTRKHYSVLKNYIDIKEILKTYKFDIVHCHMSNTNFFPLFYSWLNGVKIRINHSHNAMVKMDFKSKFFSKLAMLFDTHRFACSMEAADWLFNSRENVYILKNAIDLSRFSYDESIRLNLRKSLNVSDDEILIGNIGRFVKQKNHKFLINVFNKIYCSNHKYKLVLIGIGELLNEIKEYVSNLECSENVIFLGSRNDVPNLLQAFDLFVLPSLFEGLGIVFIEAQVSGLPCFSSKNVPLEAKISDNFYYLDLDEDLWFNAIINFKFNKRNLNLECASNSGYNIVLAALELDNLYKSFMR